MDVSIYILGDTYVCLVHWILELCLEGGNLVSELGEDDVLLSSMSGGSS